MAASDPTPYVATPTGTLQGVAAFSWDGSAWQPTGRAGPDMATPTGVLQGVAPFSWSGSAWTPAGRAQPGVATPTGVLDGVAVYTWSGSAWTPASGTATPSTPSGTLRGVAAFGWDGSAWQPAAQARASVPTPYGVLDGVAFFNWSGTAWAPGAALPPGVTLDLSFFGPTLDPSLTFTRGSTATYFDSSGVMQPVSGNTPRFDYDPVTHAALGLLIEEQRQNVWLQSADASNAAWARSNAGVVPVVVTGNNVAAPDGTTTAARAVWPLATGAAVISQMNQNFTVTAAPYTFSIWMRGSVGGEQLYLMTTPNAVLYYRTLCTLTTSWQRFTLTTPALTAVPWYFQIGFDGRDASQTSMPAQTMYLWGGQVEQGGFPTSYIPTTAAAVTRNGEFCDLTPLGAWYSSATAFTSQIEFLTYNYCTAGGGYLRWDDTPGNNYHQYTGNSVAPAGVVFSQNSAGVTIVNTSQVNLVLGSVHKIASTVVAAGDVIAIDGAIQSLGITPGAVPIGLNRIRIGNTGGGVARVLNGYMRRVRYWPRVLTNAELQSVTT